MRLSARDVYAHGLQLLDVFFLQKRNSHTLFCLNQRKRPTGHLWIKRRSINCLVRLKKTFLFIDSVNLMLVSNYFFITHVDCMNRRYKKDWDLKKFTQKANQKCQDTNL